MYTHPLTPALLLGPRRSGPFRGTPRRSPRPLARAGLRIVPSTGPLFAFWLGLLPSQCLGYRLARAGEARCTARPKCKGKINAAALQSFWHGGALAFWSARLRGGPFHGPPLGLAPIGAAAAARAAQRCSGQKRPLYDSGPFLLLGPPPPCGRGRRSSPWPLLLSQPSRGQGWAPACAAAHSGLRGPSAAAFAFLNPRAHATRQNPFFPFGGFAASVCRRVRAGGQGGPLARQRVGRCGGGPHGGQQAPPFALLVSPA